MATVTENTPNKEEREERGEGEGREEVKSER